MNKKLIYNVNNDVIKIATSDEKQAVSWFLKGYIKKPKRVNGLFVADVAPDWRFSPAFRAKK